MTPRRTVVATALALAVGVAVLAACKPQPPTGPTCNGVGNVRHADQRYAADPEVPANLQSLDVYEPTIDDACPPAPMVVYVHGGAWAIGDKGNQIIHKVDLFAQKAGWVFASVNYRLSPNPGDLDDPDAVRSPTHAQDVADAVAWLRANAASFGGDPDRIALIGHSAGAHIVSLLGTREDLLADAGVPRAAVRCVAPLDTVGFDVTEVAPGNDLYQNAFGTDPEAWPASSPQLQVTPGEDLPAFFAVTQQRAARRGPNEAFRDVLVGAGGTASVLTVPLDHAGINQAVGRTDDSYVTGPLIAFLGPCLLA